MTDSSLDQWTRLWRPWISAALAPQELWQSINPGWSFGNVTINDHNSSAPQTEQAILAEESYGRQIGKLLDAVDELIKVQPGGADANPAFRDVAVLKEKVEGLKRAAAMKRIDQLRRDLEFLKASGDASGREAYEHSVEQLRTLLLEPTEHGGVVGRKR